MAKKIVLTPKYYILFVLLFIAAIAGLKISGHHGYINILAAVLTAVFVDMPIALLRKHKRMVPDGAIITALIIALILSAHVSWLIVAATTAIAIISKHLLQLRKKPIFNPAAFGLLLALIFFSTEQDWWGAFSLLSPWILFFTLFMGFLVAHKVNKFPQVFSFLGFYFAICLGLAIYKHVDVGNVFRTPFVNMALFLSFFMLTDPPTSPGKYKDQVVFGGIAAVVGIAMDLWIGGISFLLVGLLTANFWNAWRLSKQIAN